MGIVNFGKLCTEKELAEVISKNTGKPCFYCTLCGEYFYGYGNNPYPLASSEDQCCDMCNATKVIPARLANVNK